MINSITRKAKTLFAAAFIALGASGCEAIQIYFDAMIPRAEELNKLQAEYALSSLCDMTLDGKVLAFTSMQSFHIEALCMME